jgi:predicted metal-dependent enzyme (double-stranded beta helix superfamily)
VARAVSEPPRSSSGWATPQRGEVQKLYHSPELTILNVVWAPYMTIYPHNHRMWAVIGVYTGREDNIFWRRRATKGSKPPAPRRCPSATRSRSARTSSHSVTNPIPRLTGAIHVYGGDFFGVERSEWESGDACVEGRYDAQKAMRHFEQSNARSLISEQKKLIRYNALRFSLSGARRPGADGALGPARLRSLAVFNHLAPMVWIMRITMRCPTHHYREGTESATERRFLP